VDGSRPFGDPAATEPAHVEPVQVSGMAYAKIIDGMMNVGFYRERMTSDGRTERVIVAKLVFPGDVHTVIRALTVNQSMLDGAVREEVQRKRGRGAMPRSKVDDTQVVRRALRVERQPT
jgi:hypothetical protein